MIITHPESVGTGGGRRSSGVTVINALPIAGLFSCDLMPRSTTCESALVLPGIPLSGFAGSWFTWRVRSTWHVLFCAGPFAGPRVIGELGIS